DDFLSREARSEDGGQERDSGGSCCSLFLCFKGDGTMRWTNVAALLALTGAVALAQDKAPGFRLGKDDVGKGPTGWPADTPEKGEGSVWKGVADPTAPSKSGFALAQTAESPGPMFNLCVAEGPKYKDVEVSVAFKAVKGKSDQGGGIVWRYQDPNN